MFIKQQIDFFYKHLIPKGIICGNNFFSINIQSLKGLLKNAFRHKMFIEKTRQKKIMPLGIKCL